MLLNYPCHRNRPGLPPVGKVYTSGPLPPGNPMRLASVLLLGGLCAGIVPPLAAQVPAPAAQPGNRVAIRILDRESREPVVGAQVRLGDSTGTADQDGRLVFSHVPTGRHSVLVRAVGYQARTAELAVGVAGAPPVHELDLVFDGTDLPDVVVEARRRRLIGRLVQFETRMARGVGQFLTAADIESRRQFNLGAIIGTLKGVNSRCTMLECVVRMARAPRNCAPKYYIDGIPSDQSATDTPISDVYGVEVYRGPSETPVEFLSSEAGCGVISIWTKSAARRPPGA